MADDPIPAAFTRWKVAHDAFLEAEQRLFIATRSGAFAAGSRAENAEPLLQETEAKRAQAERLLLAAMKMVHDKRTKDAEGRGQVQGS